MSTPRIEITWSEVVTYKTTVSLDDAREIFANPNRKDPAALQRAKCAATAPPQELAQLIKQESCDLDEWLADHTDDFYAVNERDVDDAIVIDEPSDRRCAP